MTKKYTIYDNDTNTVLFESDDKDSVDLFLAINSSGSIEMWHKENNIFIMYFENYTIYMKM